MSAMRALGGVMATLAMICTAAPAHAAPPPKPNQTAERLASQAKQALELGDHDRAANLYLGAFKQDPTQTVLVFNAARVLHLGRRIDRAEETYRIFLALPDIDAGLAESARQYLEEIRLSRADERALEAQQLGQQGRFAEAAAAWRNAFRIAQHRVVYLLRAARAQRLSSAPQLAVADYQDYLARATDGAERQEARDELAMLQDSLPQAAAAATPLPAAPTPAALPAAATAAESLPPYSGHAVYWLSVEAQWMTMDKSATVGGLVGAWRGAFGWQYSRDVTMYVVGGVGQQQSYPGSLSLDLGFAARDRTRFGELTTAIEFVDSHYALAYPCSWSQGPNPKVTATCTSPKDFLFVRTRLEWLWRWSASTAVVAALMVDRAIEVGAAADEFQFGGGVGLLWGRL